MKKRALPERLKVRVTNDDLYEAVCGSPTRCSIANAIRRQLDTASFVKVNVNRVTITINEMLHHYALPNNALKMVAQNDDGSLSLGDDRYITLSLINRRKAYTNLPAQRRAAIRKSEADRKAAGTMKNYSRNVRAEAARRAGRARKRLLAEQGAAA